MPYNPNDWLQYAALSDVGMRRANNQDSHAVVLAADAESWARRGHVLLVADGMGAHAAGELASKMAADGIPHAYHKRPDHSQPEAIRHAIEEINAQIHHRGQANAEFQGMGTTASALVLLPQGALVAHVGDSRVYRLRGQQLEQLSFDHSLVWEMMAAGQMSQEAIPSYIPKNIITRSLGPQADVQVDLEGPFPLEVGDTFLLCSDGLTGQINDEEIGAILGSVPPDEAAAVLIDLANLRGGPDNITVIVAKVRQGPPLEGRAIEPLDLGGDEELPKKQANPLPWIGAAACLLVGLGLFAMRQTIAGLVLLLLGLAVGLIAALRNFGNGREPRLLPPGATLGKGPHRSCKCAPSAETVETLSHITDQLRDAASEGQWSLNRAEFDRHLQQAAEAVEHQNYPLAVREQCHALRSLMRELRNQRRNQRRSSDQSDEVNLT